MLTNFWNRIELWCVSTAHDEPVRMKIMEAPSPFYACPKYMLKDSIHPDGHETDEKMCKNVLSLKEAEDVVMEFLQIVDEDLQNDIVIDYTNFHFSKGFVEARILEYSHSGKIKIGLKNNRTSK